MKHNRVFTLPVLSLIALGFILGTSEFIVVGILPDISDGLSVSLSVVGNLVSLFAAAYALGTPFVTAFTSKIRRYHLLLLLMILFLAANLLSVVAPNYGVLLVSRLLVAVVSGPLISIGMTFAGDVAPAEHRAKVIAWIFSGFSIASIVGVPLGTMVNQLFGWRMTFLFICVLGVGVLFWLAFSLPKSGEVKSTGLLTQFVLLKDRRILLGLLITVCGAAGTYVFYTYLTPVLQNELGIPEAYLSMVLLAFGVSSIVSNLLSGRIAERGGMKRLPVCFLLQAVVLACLPFTTHSLVLGLVNILALGVLMYLMNSSNQLHFLDVAGQDYPYAQNLASSLNSVSFNIGIALGSFLGSLVVDLLEMRDTGFVGGALAAMAFAAVLVLNRVERKQPA